MSIQDDDGQQGLALGLVFSLVALVVAVVVGASVYQHRKTPATPKTAVAVVTPVVPANDVPDTAQKVAQNAMDAASVKIENGVVKFYFASGKSDLATGANTALGDVIKGAQTGRNLVISGYHDATGSNTKNAELAELRAFAVRDALKASGVAHERIELKKPEALIAAGSNAEARRVEVALQ